MAEPKYLAYYITKEQAANPYYDGGCSREPKFIVEDRQKTVFLYTDDELADFILKHDKVHSIQYFTVAQIYPSVKTSISLSF